MKKVLTMTMLAVLIVSCSQQKPTSNDYGLGGRNACQFIHEQVPELCEDIESVEIAEEDSLLSDAILAFDQARIIEAGTAYLNGEMSREDYQEMVDYYFLVAKDISNSWQFGIVVNDSLHQLSKYESCWRKVYKVKVTMKSGATRDSRVLMENDGTTPRMTEQQFSQQLLEYTKMLLKANSISKKQI